jgi:hypothetical protein
MPSEFAATKVDTPQVPRAEYIARQDRLRVLAHQRGYSCRRMGPGLRNARPVRRRSLPERLLPPSTLRSRLPHEQAMAVACNGARRDCRAVEGPTTLIADAEPEQAKQPTVDQRRGHERSRRVTRRSSEASLERGRLWTDKADRRCRHGQALAPRGRRPSASARASSAATSAIAMTRNPDNPRITYNRVAIPPVLPCWVAHPERTPSIVDALRARSNLSAGSNFWNSASGVGLITLAFADTPEARTLYAQARQ